MLIEIRSDLWINSDYIVSVSIDNTPEADFPVLIAMDAPNHLGETQTYVISIEAWQHVRNWLKLYARMPLSVAKAQSPRSPAAADDNTSPTDDEL